MKHCKLISSVILLLAVSSKAFALPVCSSSQIEQLVFDTGVDISSFERDTIAEVGMYENHPINVECIDGVVCHIGINIFGTEGKEILPGHISRFVERYLLLLLTLTEDERSERLRQDRVLIEGQLSCMPLGGIEGYDVALQLDDNKLYSVTFVKEGAQSMKLTFPAECELIYGMNKRELESFFCFKINTFTAKGASSVRESSDKVRLEENVYFDKMGTYIIEDMLQGLYFSRKGDEYALIYDLTTPLYSIQNLLSEPSLAEGMMVDVAVQKYGFLRVSYTVPLKNLIDMCLSDGCKPFVGFSEFVLGQSVKAVVIMENAEEGYNHVFEFSFNQDFLQGKSTQVSAIVNAFVPTHNLANLYDENNQKRHVNDVRKILVK